MKIPYKIIPNNNGYEVVLDFKHKPVKVTDEMVRSTIKSEKNPTGSHDSMYDASKFWRECAIDFLKWEILDRQRGMGFREFNEQCTKLLGDITFAKTDEERSIALRELRNHIDEFCWTVQNLHKD